MKPLSLLIIFVFVFELSSGVVQEYAISISRLKYEWFLTFAQFSFYTVFSALHKIYLHASRVVSQNREPKLISMHHSSDSPLVGYIKVALSTFFARGLGYLAFSYMDFALKVLFTSSKPVIVMILGILFKGKSYSASDYISTIMMIFGLYIFSKEDTKSSVHFGFLAVVIMTACQLFDAFKSEYQEDVIRQQNKSNPRAKDSVSAEVDVSLWSSLIGTMLTAVVCLYTGQLHAGLQHCNAKPLMYFLLALQFLLGYIASICLLSVIKISDAYTSSIITTVRKAVSVYLSFLAFRRTFTYQHSLGCLLFFVGLLVHIYTKQSVSTNVTGRPTNKSNNLHHNISENDTTVEDKHGSVSSNRPRNRMKHL